jgi:hypothetical protein
MEAGHGASSGLLPFALASGGDARIFPDPDSGRNQYGTLAIPAPDEISFASTTASTISPGAFEAVRQSFATIFDRRLGDGDIEAWIELLRERLLHHFAKPRCEAVFTASGTDGVLIALGLICVVARRPVTSIVVAPNETGSAIPLAAVGRHFADVTALGRAVRHGSILDGMPDGMEQRTIAIRDGRGHPRAARDIDADAARAVEEELKRGRDVVLHVLDTSKTGLAGVSRRMARHLLDIGKGGVHVIVDACQLRSPMQQIGQDAADGFIVVTTGSKFAAGPAFSGGVLLPGGLVSRLEASGDLPRGLAGYTSVLDWPARLRPLLAGGDWQEANIGLGLRWRAALHGLDQLAKVTAEQRLTILRRFAVEVRSRMGLLAHTDHASDQDEGAFADPSIVCITPLTGVCLPEHVLRLYRDLRDGPGPLCHVGQPVCLGPRTVLRVAASALDVAEVAAQLAEGADLTRAFGPIAARLDRLFEKWASLERTS